MTEVTSVSHIIPHKPPLLPKAWAMRVGIPPKRNVNFDFKESSNGNINNNNMPVTSYQLSGQQKNKIKSDVDAYEQKLITTNIPYTINEMGDRVLANNNISEVYSSSPSENIISSHQLSNNEQQFYSPPQLSNNLPQQLSNNEQQFYIPQQLSNEQQFYIPQQLSNNLPLQLNNNEQQFYTSQQFHQSDQLSNNLQVSTEQQISITPTAQQLPPVVNFSLSNIHNIDDDDLFNLSTTNPTNYNDLFAPPSMPYVPYVEYQSPDQNNNNTLINTTNSSLFGILKRNTTDKRRIQHINDVSTSEALKELSKEDTVHKKDGRIKVTEKRIVCTFYNKLNIIELNIIILEYLSEKSKQARFDIEDARNKILEAQNRPQSIVQYRTSQRKLDEIDAKVLTLNSDIDAYTTETKEIIAEYTKYFSQQTVFDINYKDEDIETKKYRHRLINEYVYHAKKYIDLVVETEKVINNCCMGCGYDLVNVQADINGYIICPSCSVEQDNVVHQTYQDEEHNIAIIVKDSGYQNKENFMLILLEFQGIEDFNVPSNLIEKLDKHFSSIGGVTHEEAYKLPLNANGTRPRTSRVIMMTALEKTGFQRLYRNCRLICKIYWGWILPNITHLVDLLMEDYVESERAFQLLKDDSDVRKSCLNAHFRAWKLLNRRGFACPYTDFKPIETEKILRYHERKWTAICKMLKWDVGETLI